MVKKTKYKFKGKLLQVDDRKEADVSEGSGSCLKIQSRQLDILLCKEGLKKLNPPCCSATNMTASQPQMNGVYLQPGGAEMQYLPSEHLRQNNFELMTSGQSHFLQENRQQHFSSENATTKLKKNYFEIKTVPDSGSTYQLPGRVESGFGFHLPVREASSECLLFTQRYLEQKSTCLEVFLKNGVSPQDSLNNLPPLVSAGPYGFTSHQQPSDLSTTVVPHLVCVMVGGDMKPVTQRQGSIGIQSLSEYIS